MTNTAVFYTEFTEPEHNRIWLHDLMI